MAIDSSVQHQKAADDEQVASTLPRPLSGRELALLEQSKADFAAGRSYSHAEMIALLDEELARLGVPKSA